MRVPFYDADPMGVVHHANYLRYFENARVEWFRRRGISRASMMASNLNLAVVESQVWYRSAARFDDMLDIEVQLDELRNLSMRFAYRAVHSGESRLIAEAKTLHACVGLDMKLERIPAAMREKLLLGEAGGETGGSEP